MQDYVTFILVAAALLFSAVFIAWPWLRARESREQAVTLTLVCVFLSLALYLFVGSPFEIPLIQRRQEALRAWQTRTVGLEKSAKSAAEWTELGELYLQLEAFPKAVAAFRRAVLASGGDVDVILAYAKAQMLAADGTVDTGAKEAFSMAANIAPENPEPLFYLAVERLQAGDKPAARALFSALLPKLPEQAPLKRRVRMQLEKLK